MDDDAVSQLHIGLLHQALTLLLDMFFASGQFTTLQYLHHQSQLIWLLAHLPSQLLLHVVEVLAVFVPQAQQFNHVLCRIEGEVRLHHFKNPTKFSSDHLLFHTDKSIPQLIKC